MAGEAQRVAVPHPSKDSYQVNPDQPSTSTTDTILKRIPASSGTALTAGAVLTAHGMLHIPPLATTVLAFALLRRRAVAAGLGVVFGMLTAVFSPFYVLLKRTDPAVYFPGALARVTCALGLPVPPEALAIQEAGQRAADHTEPEQVQRTVAYAPQPRSELSPLPPATNSARNEDEPVFWGYVHDRQASRERPDSLTEPAKGRHRRVGTQAPPPTYTMPDTTPETANLRERVAERLAEMQAAPATR
jgi:hypothetical protein